MCKGVVIKFVIFFLTFAKTLDIMLSLNKPKRSFGFHGDDT